MLDESPMVLKSSRHSRDGMPLICTSHRLPSVVCGPLVRLISSATVTTSGPSAAMSCPPSRARVPPHLLTVFGRGWACLLDLSLPPALAAICWTGSQEARDHSLVRRRRGGAHHRRGVVD